MRRDKPYKSHQILIYTVEDEQGEFGFVVLNKDATVEFKITEELYLKLDEMGFIFEFMDRIKKIHDGEELDTLADEYFYNETGKAPGPDSPSEQQ
jgi:hypothetical protein